MNHPTTTLSPAVNPSMGVYTISTSYKTVGSISTDLTKSPSWICTDHLGDLDTGRNDNV